MGLSYCPTGCLALSPETPRLSFQIAAVEFQDDIVGQEILLGYDFGHSFGPFQPTLAASYTDAGGTWVGAGAKWSTQNILTGPVFAETSLLPGLYFDNDEVDIGGLLQFRASLGVGYAFDNGATVLVSYDHRSNGDTRSFNPGLETIAIRYAIALD